MKLKSRQLILLALKDGSYNVTDIAHITGLQRSSVYLWIRRLIAEDLVSKTNLKYSLKNPLTLSLKVQRLLEEKDAELKRLKYESRGK